MKNYKYFIDLKTLIVNIMYFNNLKAVSFEYLIEYINYIVDTLSKNNLLEDYFIPLYGVTNETIERSILYLSNIFNLDRDGELIFLRNDVNINELIKLNRLDDYLEYLIRTHDTETKKIKEQSLRNKISHSIDNLLINISDLYILNPKLAEQIENEFLKKINQNSIINKQNLIKVKTKASKNRI